MKRMDRFVNLLLPIATYRPILTLALGGKKLANGFLLT
jgi:hypothetical protein